MRATNKTKEAEKYVDKYILENNVPPTYKDVMIALGLKSTSVAYHRCRTFRNKMVVLVNKYNEKDLINFGNYLLSIERKKNLINKSNVNNVCHNDIENFKLINAKTKQNEQRAIYR